MTFNDTEEYSLRSVTILGFNICSQITVAHVTLPKAVLSTVKIFAVQLNIKLSKKSSSVNLKLVDVYENSLDGLLLNFETTKKKLVKKRLPWGQRFMKCEFYLLS